MKFLHQNPLSAFILAILLCLVIPSSSQGASTAVVSVVNFAFVPASTNIAAGDKVTWNWVAGAFNHNTISASPLWASSTLNGPATFSFTFTNAGNYPYSCTIHGFTGTINVSAPANLPPVVSITSPLANAVFAAPATVIIQATASDPDAGGSVTNVQFLVGTTVLSNDIAAPFTAVTNNLSAGTYTLSAIASDNLGAKMTNSINIIVDAPPVVTITNPAPGEVFATPANVTIQAQASDVDGTVTDVKFLVDATVLADKAAGPFTATTNNLAVGGHTLSAIATDNNGIKFTNSVAVTVVDPLPLALSAPQMSPASFQFGFAANIGLTYIVQWSTNLDSTNWITVFTNQAASNPVVFVDDHATNNPGFYRVGRQPNP